MDQRGKVINVAFAVSAAFVFGDHLGFTAGFDPEMLVPVILGSWQAASRNLCGHGHHRRETT